MARMHFGRSSSQQRCGIKSMKKLETGVRKGLGRLVGRQRYSREPEWLVFVIPMNRRGKLLTSLWVFVLSGCSTSWSTEEWHPLSRPQQLQLSEPILTGPSLSLQYRFPNSDGGRFVGFLESRIYTDDQYPHPSAPLRSVPSGAWPVLTGHSYGILPLSTLPVSRTHSNCSSL